ncbi:hydrogenase expression/formation protein HypE [Aneurinibacillus terranovensis]|uniref:hydrogenase expression/formation protein HypE n=1 Tax=Aneurinibacillus terranovensis TaxID=278991 RepID=UPI0004090D1D|nr:hydrogenase expression/formation protein HypE [Aneurinibacillus terranovensis]
MSMITLAHGEGGEQSHRLIQDIFVPYFSHGEEAKYDGAILPAADLLRIGRGELVVTTDSFVVKPLFFPGGNIGKLAIAGTVNDLAVSGAVPLYVTAAFILEEGFLISQLEEIVSTMASEARKAGVRIVAGDTKVVQKGKTDGVFITTTGVGIRRESALQLSASKIEEGDAVIVTGTVGDHGTAILMERERFEIDHNAVSDCACLNHMLLDALDCFSGIRLMRDATRGGLATVLVEWAEDFGLTIELVEEKVPVSDAVKGIAQLLGYDPLYLPNEGKAVLLVENAEAEKVLAKLQSHEAGKGAAIIGTVKQKGGRQLLFKTPLGIHRRLHRLNGVQLPRIC